MQRCTKTLTCNHRCPSVCGENCPSEEYCSECCQPNKMSHVVDLYTFSSYAVHDVNEDPIIVLPCGHFYSATTLDGHFGMSQSYDINENGDFVGLKSLLENCRDVKPKQCPDCRSAVHSVKRYGRLLAFVRLRVLERKHIMVIEKSIRLAERQIEDRKKSPTEIEKTLKRIERDIARGPMRRVFEACSASNLIEVTAPPLRSTIKLIQLMARSKEMSVKKKGDPSYFDAINRYKDAIKLCDETSSSRFGAELRLKLAELLLKWNNIDEVKEQVISLLDLILKTAGIFHDIIQRVTLLKDDVMNKKKIISEVIAAMNQVDDYNYGGSW